MDIRTHKSWTSVSKGLVSCGPGDGEKLLDRGTAKERATYAHNVDASSWLLKETCNNNSPSLFDVPSIAASWCALASPKEKHSRHSESSPRRSKSIPSGPHQDNTSRSRSIFRDCITEGVSHPFFLSFAWCMPHIAEIPPLAWGVSHLNFRWVSRPIFSW